MKLLVNGIHLLTIILVVVIFSVYNLKNKNKQISKKKKECNISLILPQFFMVDSVL